MEKSSVSSPNSLNFGRKLSWKPCTKIFDVFTQIFDVFTSIFDVFTKSLTFFDAIFDVFNHKMMTLSLTQPKIFDGFDGYTPTTIRIQEACQFLVK